MLNTVLTDGIKWIELILYKILYCVILQNGVYLTIFCKKFHLAGTLGIKTISYTVCMNHIGYALRDQLSEVFEDLSDDKKANSRCLQNEGIILVKQLLNLAKHILDLCAKKLTTGLRSPETCIALLHRPTAACIENLPFEGEDLLTAPLTPCCRTWTRVLRFTKTQHWLLRPSMGFLGTSPVRLTLFVVF